MSDLTEQCCETPLSDLLRGVPFDHRISIPFQFAADGTETGHHMIPVGRHAHKAADALESQAARIAELEAHCARLREALMQISQYDARGCCNPLPNGDHEHDCIAIEALAATPEQSLAHAQAETLEEAETEMSVTQSPAGITGRKCPCCGLLVAQIAIESARFDFTCIRCGNATLAEFIPTNIPNVKVTGA